MGPHKNAHISGVGTLCGAVMVMGPARGVAPPRDLHPRAAKPVWPATPDPSRPAPCLRSHRSVFQSFNRSLHVFQSL